MLMRIMMRIRRDDDENEEEDDDDDDGGGDMHHETSESIEATPHPWGNWSRSGPRRRAVFSHSSFSLPGGSLMTLEGMV
jgi:hypothetical protein